MASLKCSKCGYGIHYHDEADGTQMILFKKFVWDELVHSNLSVSRYILDGTEDYYLIWKCKECGSLYFFRGKGTTVWRAYQIADNIESNQYGESFVGFSDIDWDVITEEKITGKSIIEKFPRCKKLIFKMINDNLYLFDSDKAVVPSKVYKLMNISQE